MKRIVLILALALTACWRMTVKNDGVPIGQTPIEYDGKWHSGLLWGMAELSGPYDMSKVCARGWSQIHTETPFVQGLVQALTFSIYSPQGVTIRCAAR